MASASANVTINMFLVRKLIGGQLRDQIGLAARPFVASVIMACVVLLLGQVFPATGTNISSILGLAAMVVAGAITFAASLFALHAVFGGPASAEREFVGLALAGLAKVRAKASSSR